ncbi:MAG: metallophosphoesterase [Gemmatimonadaceae bacterium]
MRLLQVSDVHFGRHAVAGYTDAITRRVASKRYDAVVVAGDLTQRNFRWQFRQAKAFLDALRAHAPVVVVPGNHDVAWWWKPFGIGPRWPLLRGYRKWISPDVEPSLRLPGVTIVALNSCHGIQPYTLTKRPRDLSIVGAITPGQWARARAAFAAAPAADLKVLVFHHNLLRGDLSRRWGLAARADAIGDALDTGAQLVLNGHDHQTRIEEFALGARRTIVSHSASFCERTRGGLPASFQEVEVDPTEVRVRACVWSAERGDFEPRQDRCFTR